MQVEPYDVQSGADATVQEMSAAEMLTAWMSEYTATWNGDEREGLFVLVADALAALSASDAENVALRRVVSAVVEQSAAPRAVGAQGQLHVHRHVADHAPSAEEAAQCILRGQALDQHVVERR